MMRDIRRNEPASVTQRPALRLLPAMQPEAAAPAGAPAAGMWWERLLWLAAAPGLGRCWACGSEDCVQEQRGAFAWAPMARCRRCGECWSAPAACLPDDWLG